MAKSTIMKNSFFWGITAFIKNANAVEFSPWPMPSSFSNGSESGVLASNFEFLLEGSAINSEVLQQGISRYESLINIDNSTIRSGLTTCTIKVDNVDNDNEIASLRLDMNESYQLNIDVSECSIHAATVWGALHSLETFTQALVNEGSESSTIPTLYNLPLIISDAPRFTHRGFMIDTSRHFLPISFIEHIIDGLSYNKYNVLHWHMVDAQSFPLETENDHCVLLSEGAYSPKLLYTLNDINTITNYAGYRGIRLVLEIDVPGHAASWGDGYADIMADCEVKYSYNINDFALNPTIDQTYEVLGGVMSDLYNAVNVSSSTTFNPVTIHLGGDEVVYGCWANDSSITAFMQSMAIDSYDDLLGYFVANAQNLATSTGFESTTQWEEVFNAGLASTVQANTIFQIWESEENIKTITSAGFRTIASPNAYWYLDISTSTWDVMYNYDPSVGLTAVELSNLIGGEAAMWGEHADASNFDALVHMRSEAVAERLWSSSMQGVTSDSDPSVFARLLEHRCRLLNRGVGSMPLQPGYCANNWV